MEERRFFSVEGAAMASSTARIPLILSILVKVSKVNPGRRGMGS